MRVLLSILLDFIIAFFSSSTNSCLGGGKKKTKKPQHQTGWKEQLVGFFLLSPHSFQLFGSFLGTELQELIQLLTAALTCTSSIMML